MKLKCWKSENSLSSPVSKFMIQLENGTTMHVLANDIVTDHTSLTFWVRFTIEPPQLIAIFRNWEFVVITQEENQ